MKNLYNKSFKIYLIFFVLAVIGIIAGGKLPISLFPNTTQPKIYASVRYSKLTSNEFLKRYGKIIEGALNSYEGKDIKATKVTAKYYNNDARYVIKFRWKDDPKKAMMEMQQLFNSYSSNWPSEIKDSLKVDYWMEGSGFLAVSIFSHERNILDTYKLMKPAVDSFAGKINDASSIELFNPEKKEVSITLDINKINSLKLTPQYIIDLIKRNLSPSSAGRIESIDNSFNINITQNVSNLETLKKLQIPVINTSLFLEDIADISLKKDSSKLKIFKTDGIKSLILFATPKMGGNIKKMSEDIKFQFNKSLKTLPKDIQYKILIDPARFIKNSVNNVIHEIFIAAGLAVFIMFLFIGSFKNTVTAAIEIPLSMILAFIIMKLTNMNLNLISLSGLSLAAGMNVDASVVVLENIFRYFKIAEEKKLNIDKKELIRQAVSEVKVPIIASTLSTIVVFAPLAFTHGLTNGILGDLAKAVVFSHSASLFIALILVPTIRTHLSDTVTKSSIKSPIEKILIKLEDLYARALRGFIASNVYKTITLLVFTSLFLLCAFVFFPNIKKELIGTPNSDWLIISMNSSKINNISEMSDYESEIKDKLLTNFPTEFHYTFEQVRKRSAYIMARVKVKKDSEKLQDKIKELFPNTPDNYFWIGQWNPSSMPLPREDDMHISIKNGSLKDRHIITSYLRRELKDSDLYERVGSIVDGKTNYHLKLTPKQNIINNFKVLDNNFSFNSVKTYTQLVSDGYRIDTLQIDNKSLPLMLNFKDKYLNNINKLKSFPLFINGNIYPISSVTDIKLEKENSVIMRIDGVEQNTIFGKNDKKKMKKSSENKKSIKENLIATKLLITNFKKSKLRELNLSTKPLVEANDGKVELNSSLKNLTYALIASVLLILLTLLIQFENFVHSFIVMMAIPFGILGGITSLYVFNSTISLNSVLGIILLNGVAVNNSIILADFIKNIHSQGLNSVEAAIIASRKRLRPILITSLTTILGMLPIALGLGDGGKIIQPLGIVVTSGLWFSMVFTLFVVPSLEERYLRNKEIEPMSDKSNSNIFIDDIKNNEFEASQTWQ